MKAINTIVSHPSRVETNPMFLPTSHLVGKRVILSEYGKQMQRSHKKTGKIITQMLAGMRDWSVEVKWDGQKKTVWMHESQVTIVNRRYEEANKPT